MKLNKIFLTAGLFAVALTSCTDLDVAPNSQYTEDPSKNSGVDPMIMVEAKMADVYFHLAGTFGRRYMEAQCLASDEFTALAFDGGYYDSGTYAHQALHNSSATDASLDWYSELTSGITKANTILEELGESASDQMKAPARAMRAFFTWILMDSFGDTPILEKVPAEGDATMVSAFRPYFVSAAIPSSSTKTAKAIIFSGDYDGLIDEPLSVVDGTLEIYTREHNIVTTSHLQNPVTITVGSVAGITYANYVLPPGETIETPVRPGVYIVNRKKLLVKP